MAWRLARSLIKLRDQINQLAPNRSNRSDGSIGDAAHSSRVSDHNPDRHGVVAAIDVTNDPVGGVAGETLSRAVTNDPRTKYVIFNGMIWKARTGKWEPYRGANPHRQHVHISVKTELYDNIEPWTLSIAPSPVKPSRPVLKRGDRGDVVRELQSRLRRWSDIGVDGIFGDSTERAVRYFQRLYGLDADGRVGPATYKALGL